MAKVIRTATDGQVEAVARARRHLRDALDALKQADCPRTADRVRAAIKSCDGAMRHAEHRSSRTRDDGLAEGAASAA